MMMPAEARVAPPVPHKRLTPDDLARIPWYARARAKARLDAEQAAEDMARERIEAARRRREAVAAARPPKLDVPLTPRERSAGWTVIKAHEAWKRWRLTKAPEDREGYLVYERARSRKAAAPDPRPAAVPARLRLAPRARPAILDVPLTPRERAAGWTPASSHEAWKQWRVTRRPSFREGYLVYERARDRARRMRANETRQAVA
jgi:hypothetical protein